MPKSLSELKELARDTLPGNYLMLVGALIITELLVTLLESPFSTRINTGLSTGSYTAIIMGYAGITLVSLLGSLCRAGKSRMHLEACANRKVRLADLLYAFKNRPDRYIGYYFLKEAIKLACIIPAFIAVYLSSTAAAAALSASSEDTFTILQIVAAAFQSSLITCILAIVLAVIGAAVYIIVILNLSQTIYLMLDNTDVRVIDSVKKSSSIMKGSKWRLIKLYISFIGWGLLCLATLGIAMLWVKQYLDQVLAEFYIDLERPGVYSMKGAARY